MSFFIWKGNKEQISLPKSGDDCYGLYRDYCKRTFNKDLRPIRHKKYGLGWMVEWGSSGIITFFFDDKDILLQELMAAQIWEKERKK